MVEFLIIIQNTTVSQCNVFLFFLYTVFTPYNFKMFGEI